MDKSCFHFLRQVHVDDCEPISQGFGEEGRVGVVQGGDSIALKCAGGDDGGDVLVLGGVGGDD